MKAKRRTTGADLESRVASGGTARLSVNHEEVSYYIDLNRNGYKTGDLDEIREYLDEHGFETMDPDECPWEAVEGAWRVWVCHKEGREFNLASVLQVATFSCISAGLILIMQMAYEAGLAAA